MAQPCQRVCVRHRRHLGAGAGPGYLQRQQQLASTLLIIAPASENHFSFSSCPTLTSIAYIWSDTFFCLLSCSASRFHPVRSLRTFLPPIMATMGMGKALIEAGDNCSVSHSPCNVAKVSSLPRTRTRRERD